MTLSARPYHIAFEHGIDMWVIMEIAHRAGLSLKTHMSPLDVEAEERLRGAVDRLKEEVLSRPAPEVLPEEVVEGGAPLTAPISMAEAITAAVKEPPKPEPAQPPEAEVEEKKVVKTAAAAAKPAPSIDDKIKAKPASIKKRKRIKEDIKPLDSAEILDELKGRFLSSGMKDIMGAGRRPIRPRSHRPRRSIRGPSRKSSKSSSVPAQLDREIDIRLPITVKELSKTLGVKAAMIVKHLMDSGTMMTMNDSMSDDLVELVALEFGRTVKVKKAHDIEDLVQEAALIEGREEDLVHRSPVVAFLGHVDHGKTSLLDQIRKSNVQAGEAGGITQHIGAYRVPVLDKTIVFLDTPGHEAFTDMRARGAQVTDIVVLVVAADDGVMPQTEEAVNHARAAGVPILVAMNKVDKAEGSNILRAKQQLAGLGLELEEWGGETLVIETSAVQGKGIQELLEGILLVADLLEIKSDPSMPARGTVLEAQIHEGRGVVTTALVTAGTLRIGDVILTGHTYGRVKALYDDKSRPLSEAGPSMPVVISGLNDLPRTGDRFLVVEDEAAARKVAGERALRDRVTSGPEHVTLENLFSRLEEGEIAEVPLIIKADGQGSIAALQEQLENLSTKEVKVRILHTGVGGINESDVLLAHASDAIIVGFHVVPGEKARILGKDKGVDIRLFSVIYKVLDDIKAALEGSLAPEEVEVIKGHAEVRQVFRITRAGNVAGCMIRDGVMDRNDQIRLIRDDVVIYGNGRLQTLKRHKDDVREVKEGFECGIKIAGYEDIKAGDVIEAYKVSLIPRKLSTVEKE